MIRAFLVLALLASSTARADDEQTKHSYRAVIDRVDLEPSTLSGYRLRIYLSALSINGQLLDLTDPKSIKLKIGASEKKIPYSLGHYGATNGETAIVIMVQGTLDYGDTLQMIGESIDRDLLGQLSDRVQVSVMTFGESVGNGKLAAIKSVRGKVQLSGDNTAGDPTLLDTLDRALRLLKKAKTEPEGKPIRKMVVIVGDGRDLASDKDRVTRTGMRAAKDGVRIHSVAYSANDVRRPMLALGELSKKSLGTFRWVRKAAPDSWKAAFEQLREEINKQYVLTYYVSPSEEVAGKRLHIVTVGRTEATSNELKVPEPTCGAVECTSGYCANDKCLQYSGGGGRGVFGWILLVGGIIVGLLVVLGIVGFVMSKMQQTRVQHPAYPGMPVQPGMPAQPQPKPKKQKKGPAPPPPPGFLPNGRPIPALIITSGPRAGERHTLRNGYLIGKQPGCDLIIEDGYTSSQHAQIGMDPNGVCTLYDRGSTNGTYVNGVRITTSPLMHGIVIKIGSTEMRFLAE